MKDVSHKTIAYVEAVLTEESKMLLKNFVQKVVTPSDYCYLKRKGGIVTEKSHLTLCFGLWYEALPREKIKEACEHFLKEVAEVFPKKLTLFSLGQAPCKALVLEVEDKHHLLSKWHQYFASYPRDPKYLSQPFRPHITLAYVKKFFCIPNNVPEIPEKLHFQHCHLKIFGPRRKKD